MRKRLLLILSILLSFTLLAAACGDDDDTTTEDPADTPVDDAPVDDAPVDDAPVDDTPVDDTPVDDGSVGLVFDIGGEGDQSFNDSAAAGLARAEAEFGLTTTKLSPNDDGSNRAELLQLLADSNDLVIAVGFLFADDATEVSGANADTNFGVIDDAMLDFDNGGVPRSDNAAGLTFAEEQGSFLVGAAAASVSETGTIGFIGGVCCFGLIEKFQAGYIAGAKAVNPDIEIISDYITEFPNFDGFNDPAAGRETALAIYEAGADVIYHAAGGTGAGVFAAAKETSEASGSKVWGIGVDSDQYNTVDADVQEYVLTSMLKRVDAAVFEIISAHIAGDFTSGNVVYDLSVDGVGYSTSGDFLSADLIAALEDFKAQIIAGDIVVPTDPAEA
ncbi:MAG: basic membrane protein A [Candidatus Aldehydirespiratoraceae bacterium]|jgi:basic membrane protein A